MAGSVALNPICNCGQHVPSIAEDTISASVARIVQTLATWRRRSRERAELSRLSDRLLKDIGVTREQVRKEVAKSFWM